MIDLTIKAPPFSGAFYFTINLKIGSIQRHKLFIHLKINSSIYNISTFVNNLVNPLTEYRHKASLKEKSFLIRV
jgi:hypothetical protein